MFLHYNYHLLFKLRVETFNSAHLRNGFPNLFTCYSVILLLLLLLYHKCRKLKNDVLGNQLKKNICEKIAVNDCMKKYKNVTFFFHLSTYKTSYYYNILGGDKIAKLACENR